MQDTEQINYIADCLTNYKIKIQALNKAGLFDSAKLFEYFALEICCLWFKQHFYNLNEIQANYPCVDLVSEDEQIYVQVSTVQDIPAKIKSTLDKISTSKINDLARIKQVYFFVLGNESAEKVLDYQVGDIYLIVGSGLYGAVMAQQLQAAGKKVLVIDKRPHIAGNVYTENVEGIHVV